jgi:Kef-type K+ transport system membrane component KefB/mannitol/fructose-specific phosphotransferase system IIA component (Ntr-type)
MTAPASALPVLPLADPVLIVAVAMAVFLVVPLFFERLGIPGIIGLIVAGAALGPHGLGVLERDRTIVLLGTVGLLYLMLMVGLELDLEEFARHRARSLVFGLASAAIPGSVGTGAALALGYSTPSALLVGSAFASHTLLAYPLASRLGIVRNRAVIATLGGTILTEILALVVLAVVVESRGQPAGWEFWVRLGVPFAAYGVLVLGALPRVGRWFFRNASEGETEFVFVLTALFTVSYLAHFGRVEPLIGALLTGLALNRLIPEQSPLMNRIRFVGNAVFIPFFLLSVGMVVDVRALDTAGGWALALALALLVIAAKWLAARVTQGLFGYTRDEGWVVFGLSVPHAAGTLAIVLVGFDAGLLDQAEVNGVVVMILATCLVGPWAVQRFGRRVTLAEARRPYDPASAPRRVLVPLANPATTDTLVDLALIVRGRDAAEPLRVMTVVLGEDGAVEAAVAEAEAVLSHAVLHAAGADVPVIPMTRVDTSIASGIARAVGESRTSTVVIGWDGRRSGTRAVFGTVLDQLLDRTLSQVLVAHLARPLRTTRRVAVVVPRELERHPGFRELLRAVNTLASGVGAPALLLPVDGEAEPLRKLHAPVRPHVSAAVEPVHGWEALDARLGALSPDDLTVVLAARRGMPGWSARLERVPARLAAAGRGNLVVAYAADSEGPGEDAGEAAAGLAPGMAPDRVVVLGGGGFAAAAEQMLEGVFAAGERREIVRALVRAEEQFSSEVLPGIALPHVRREDLRRPVLLMGVSRDGIMMPRGTAPVRLLFLLVSPAGEPEEHLRAVAALARLLSSPGRVAEIVERYAPGMPRDWLPQG